MKKTDSIWAHDFDLQVLREYNKKTMIENLGIELTNRGDNFLEGSMPVDHRTQRPFGVLHGGALCALAETLGSIAGNMTIDFEKEIAVGMNLNASYLRPVNEGQVFGKAMLVHKGKKTQLWDISICNDQKLLVCIARLTLSIVAKS